MSGRVVTCDKGKQLSAASWEGLKDLKISTKSHQTTTKPLPNHNTVYHCISINQYKSYQTDQFHSHPPIVGLNLNIIVLICNFVQHRRGTKESWKLWCIDLRWCLHSFCVYGTFITFHSIIFWIFVPLCVVNPVTFIIFHHFSCFISGT